MNSGLLIEIFMGVIMLGLAAGTAWAAWSREWRLAVLGATALVIVGAAIWLALNAWKA